MRHLSASDIAQLDKRYRANLINGISGVRPVNLIGTVSTTGRLNVAVFNSVVHIGANPPCIGFIMRPVGKTRRHTYENIKRMECFSINGVPGEMIEKAHFTSAKFDEKVSEFDACGLDPWFGASFPAPFVKRSPICIGLHFEEEKKIRINDTRLVIGRVAHIFIEPAIIGPEGFLDLAGAGIAAVGDLNSYYQVKAAIRMPYARPDTLPLK